MKNNCSCGCKELILHESEFKCLKFNKNLTTTKVNGRPVACPGCEIPLQKNLLARYLELKLRQCNMLVTGNALFYDKIGDAFFIGTQKQTLQKVKFYIEHFEALMKRKNTNV